VLCEVLRSDVGCKCDIMSSALNAKRAVIIIGSISAAVVCASYALHCYYKRRSSVRRRRLSNSSSSKSRSSLKARSSSRDAIKRGKKEVVARENEEEFMIKSSSSTEETEMTTTVATYANGESGRGGRRDYRHHRRNRDEAAVQMNECGSSESTEKAVGANASSKSAFQSLPSHQAPTSCVSKQCQTGNIFNDPAIV